eukprot:1161960-Pelagomonas_calceolata.AAC.7
MAKGVLSYQMQATAGVPREPLAGAAPYLPSSSFLPQPVTGPGSGCAQFRRQRACFSASGASLARREECVPTA